METGRITIRFYDMAQKSVIAKAFPLNTLLHFVCGYLFASTFGQNCLNWITTRIQSNSAWSMVPSFCSFWEKLYVPGRSGPLISKLWTKRALTAGGRKPWNDFSTSSSLRINDTVLGYLLQYLKPIILRWRCREPEL